jgi:hypothetical protein
LEVLSATRHCNAACTAWGPSCGDGNPDAGHELCDDGLNNGDAWSVMAHCRADCQGLAPYCGDGVFQAASEQCEGSELASNVCSSFADYTAGALSCTPSCAFELAACTGPYSPGSWYGLGGSDLGPHATRLQGSASGCGVAGLAPAMQSANRPSVAVDAEGHIVVAWSEVGLTAGRASAYLLRHDGTGWRELGRSASGNGISRAGANAINVRVALSRNGFPVVAWEEASAYSSDVYVKSWNGTSWVELGGSATSGGVSATADFSTLPDIAVDDQQRPIVVWQENKVQYYSGTKYGAVFAKRFDGVRWVELGGSATGYGISNFSGHKYGDEPRVVIDAAGRPVVAWAENRGPLLGGMSDVTGVYVRRFEDGAWRGIAGSDDLRGVSAGSNAIGPRRPSIAEDANGHLWVAWDASLIGARKDVYVATFDGSTWAGAAGSLADGGVGATSPDSLWPNITIDAAGRPVVAWFESTGLRQVYARRLGATAWEELGGSASGSGISGHLFVAEFPALATNGSGEPLVVWQNQTSTCGNSVYLRQWDGAAWSELDPQPVGGGLRSTYPSVPGPRLAVDSAGVPTVAFLGKPAATDQLYVRAFDGSGWPGLAGSDTGGGVGTAGIRAIYPALALDEDRRPVSAWVELPGVAPWYRLYLRRWNGSAWIELGGSATGDGIAVNADGLDAPAVALDPGGNPVVAWRSAVPGTLTYEVYLKRWDGNAWVELGGSATGAGVSQSGGKATDLALAIDATGQVLVAWGANGEVYAKLWNGSAWSGVGTSANTGGISASSTAASYAPAAAFDGSGQPLVAWLESVAARQYRICLRRFDGASWAELAGSATGNGIAGALVDTGRPSLAIDRAGNPIVAWDQESLGVREIYARRWSGTVWVHLGGSDRGGGISNSHAASQEPSLAAGGGRICVAWTEDATRSPQLLVRCIDDP